MFPLALSIAETELFLFASNTRMYTAVICYTDNARAIISLLILPSSDNP